MDESKIAIIGATGQLGSALCDKYPSARALTNIELDITDVTSVDNYDWSAVSVIINAAAYTNVDKAETENGRIDAWKVNAVGVRNLSNAAIKNNITLVHISTDYVFDGTKTSHREDESFTPLSVYGQSKAAGDIVASLVPSHYLLRTSWVVGNAGNFVRTMFDLGSRGKEPTVVSDQMGRLTFTDELVRIIDHLLTSRAPFGTYNATNSGDVVSWAEIARSVFSIANFDLKVFDISTLDYLASKHDTAPRPLNSTLELSKLESTGFTTRDWRENLTECINKELKT